MESGEGIERSGLAVGGASFPVESGEGIERTVSNHSSSIRFLSSVESGEGIERLLPRPSKQLNHPTRVESGEGIESSPNRSCPSSVLRPKWNPVKELKGSHNPLR